MPEPRSFTHHLRVSYADCTLGNHVYYGRYLELLEVARGAFFRHIGQPCASLQQGRTIFQVVECHLRYLKPARYDDELSIRIRTDEIRKVRFRFLYEIYRNEERLLEGSTLMVCADLEEKPKRIPDEVLEALSAFQIAS